MPIRPAQARRLVLVLTLGLALAGCTSGSNEPGESQETADGPPTLSLRSRPAPRPRPGDFWQTADVYQSRDMTDYELTHDDIEHYQYIAALDKFTGEVRWKRPRAGAHAYSTPLWIQADGSEQVVSVSGGGVAAYDLRSGSELWWCRHDGYSVVPRPVFGHGLVFFCTGYDRPRLLAVDPSGDGDVTDTHVVWEAERGVPLLASPLLAGNELYCVTDLGVVTCFDARTGSIHWQHRLGGAYSASPLFADGRLYFFGEDGTTHVVAPGPQARRLAVNQLDGRVLASPAVSGRSLLVRTEGHLYRIEAPGEEQAAGPPTEAGSFGNGGDWPQFRGPDGQGRAAGTGLPLEWGEDHNVIWKTPIPGQGWSSPVVHGGRIWLTAALDDGKVLRAVCLDRETGRIVHEVDVFRRRSPEAIHPKNSRATPTPVVDAERIYVHFGADGTACLSHDGEILWRTRLPYWQHHGPAGSPILVDDLLIVNCDGFDRPYHELDMVFEDE